MSGLEAGPSGTTTADHTPKGKTPAAVRAKPLPRPVEAFDDPGLGEEETVHEVYERIAPHFSQTRHKPWPLISNFLNSLPPHSLGLDSGAGNGKYLPTAHDAGHAMIALDRSSGLLEIARGQRGAGDVVRGDLGARCWRNGVFDFAISVAAIHHLSTPERRRQAVQALLPSLEHRRQGPYARFFIYVWAYEQGPLSKRAMGSTADSASASASAGIAAGHNPTEERKRIQNVLVPWVLKATAKQKAEGQEDEVHHRYYHLFTEGELREMVESAAEHEGYRILPPVAANADADTTGATAAQDQGGEQDSADHRARWLRVRGEGWEADNWWIEAEVGLSNGFES